MIKEYVPRQRRHDDFYEGFMEQGIRKLNNPEQLSMKHSLVFPIQTLHPVFTAPPRRRISNTCGDSGVTFPIALSPAMLRTPSTSHIPQPYLMSLASRMDHFPSAPSQPLTPIQKKFWLTFAKPRRRHLNKIVPSLIILAHSVRFRFALDTFLDFEKHPFFPFGDLVFLLRNQPGLHIDFTFFYFITDQHDEMPQSLPQLILADIS